MFTFVENYEFEWPVTVIYPGLNGPVEKVFTARFLLVDEDSLFARPDLDGGDMAAILTHERDTLSTRWVGWSGIQSETGADVPFTPETRDRLLRQRPIREAVARAYHDAVIRGAVTEKN
ncbi:hypothetical protein [Paracoccus sp. (in: a-proteobacteria)]|uniref:hypothetical protein n=1 Tax=Paracoccus sp. TaxID=267 RepID=UPI0026DF8325|nr:hypothetical protein [Paracoccus sp. (in: a-proteobacteria)]MDO5648864.1 hypothetical protein [Paracoccus sp. (in: a-proteobacteria)]